MLNKIKKVGGDVLFEHINKHNIHDAIAMLDEGEVDKNAVNINGMTALHFAVES